MTTRKAIFVNEKVHARIKKIADKEKRSLPNTIEIMTDYYEKNQTHPPRMTNTNPLIEAKLAEFEKKYNGDWCLSGCVTCYKESTQEDCEIAIKAWLTSSLTTLYHAGVEDGRKECITQIEIAKVRFYCPACDDGIDAHTQGCIAFTDLLSTLSTPLTTIKK
jgi:hypothetical protein